MLHLEVQGQNQAIAFSPMRVILAGFTASDPQKARAHIDELRREGIVVPDRIPWFGTVSHERLSTAASLDVGGAAATSGEVEAVLLVHESGWYLGVGSDHTDREREKRDMEAAKADFLKILAPRVWPYDAVRSEWDTLEISSRVRLKDAWQPYQHARLGDLLPPERILEHLGAGVGPGTAVFLGTIPTLGGLVFGDAFAGALTRPQTGERLEFCYGIESRIAGTEESHGQS